MSIEQVQSALEERFAGALSDVSSDQREYRATVDRAVIAEACRLLREDLGFDYLACLAGVDRGECIEVIYRLYGMETKLQVVLRTRAPKDDCRVPTVASVWQAAQWHERETAEMLGVTFEGHPDPRHMLLPDGWVGCPLRKDYEQAPDYTRPSQLSPEVWAEFARRVGEEY